MAINEFIAGILKVPPQRIAADTHMKQVPEWDSLKHMELIVALEKHYKIELTGDEIAEMVSVEAIYNTLKKRGVCK